MKPLLIGFFLLLSSFFAVLAVLTASPRKMILGWLGVGLLQSFFFLVIGFELIALLNVFFTIGIATVIKLFSSLYGSEEAFKIESKVSIRDLIFGLGQTLTVGAALLFALSEVSWVDRFHGDLVSGVFANTLVERFPELPWVLGFILFLTLVVGSTVARPAWKKVMERSK